MIPKHTVCAEHQEICDLMPWYVNGTLAEADRHRLEAHVRTCSACGEDLEQERRIYRAMAADAGLEYMPTASFKRLQASLEAPLPEAPLPEAAVDAPAVAHYAGSRLPRRIPRFPPRLAAAASIVAAVVALSVMSARMHWGTRDPSADYHTVTNSAPRPPDEVIRAVFSPTMTLVELQAILDEAHLRIVSGPTEAGVYSLAATSHQPVNSSLALLRRHPSVRFAELTRSGDSAGAGESP
jgi:hypothetical protein